MDRSKTGRLGQDGIGAVATPEPAQTERVPLARDRRFGWSAEHPRPTERTHPYADLPKLQAEWDKDDENRRFVEERNAESRRAQAEKAEAAKRARAEAALEAATAELRAGYFSAPGATEEAFRADLPDLLAERRRQAALAGPVALTSPIDRRQMVAGDG